MLQTINRGMFADRLDADMAAAIEALEALPNERGTATMNVTISISIDSGRVDIKPSVKTKLPEGKAFTSTPFWSYNGGLSVQHPSQADMFSGPRDTAVKAVAIG